MKSTGIVRKLDALGRIVIPIELREVMDIQVRDTIEIYTDGDKIVLRKYAPGCAICGEVSDDEIHLQGKPICRKCAMVLARSVRNAG